MKKTLEILRFVFISIPTAILLLLFVTIISTINFIKNGK